MTTHFFRIASLGWSSFVAVSGIAIASAILTGFIAVHGSESEDRLLKAARARFQPIPKDAGTAKFPVIPERVDLGRKLFFDPRISADGTGSCMRCHQPALYGTDALPKSLGLHDKVLPRNAPTVLNAALNFKTHWDGMFENVEAQARQALLGPGFVNSDHAAAMTKIKAIPGYVELFHKAFPDDADAVTADNWGVAIGAYERTLVISSRFDDYLGGKTDALSETEQRGLRTFIDTGCVECHSGAAIGGGTFQKFGVTGDYWKLTRSQEIDKGRFNITKNEDDLYVFKVAGLRNVAMSPPYFHDGSVSSLPETVRIMAKLQLGADLSDSDVSDVVAFLKSLTGELPESFVNAPVLPPATFDSAALMGTDSASPQTLKK